MRRFLAASASKNDPMKHSFQGTQEANQKQPAEVPCFPQGALLSEVQVLQLPHFFLVFLLELLCCFVLWSKSHTDSRSESGRGQMAGKGQGTERDRDDQQASPSAHFPPTALEAALTQCV